MVVCLSSCTTDSLPRTTNNNNIIVNNNKNNPFLLTSSRGRRFDSREALLFLRRGNTSFKQLKQIHAQIIRNGLHDHFLLTKLLLRLCFPPPPPPSSSSSSSHFFNRMEYATSLFLFHQTQNPPTTFTWNLMIRSHTLNGTSHQALLIYHLMIHRDVLPDNFTFPFVIKACLVSSAPILQGKEVHSRAIKTGFSSDIFVQNTLMDFYFKCGDPVYGRKVFDNMLTRTIVSWTTMLVGLISCGELEAARDVFELMPDRNVVSWTAMISGYARNKQPQEAFELFRRMQLDNVMPNEYTLVSLLVACTELGSLKLGCWIHDFAHKNGFELGVFLGTALIDMYSKCGSLEDARKVFDKMPIKSTVTWNSMITSLGVHGRGDEALRLFREMEKANVEPDAITFVGVLCACLNGGLVDEGCRYFRYMRDRYGITPIMDHYVCMIELLGRAGMLDEAYQLVNIMQVKPNDDIWEALLRASFF
ncbi:Pentatricopeptide repeat [Macleaya cordata]|uniref:Pentatricopeptide repeat n=1 Tax=Macleaya cordata TaxID=56857 RepID=A0A200R3N2_MACCD|nr:Pentatricopeptide repeat [Macleaya cordata]